MEMAYLGLFQKIFNWVLDKIFDPIFKWLSNLLNTVFTWIFNTILEPILLPILETWFKACIAFWKTILCDIVYLIFSGILKLVDYMETAFNIFIGIDTVTLRSNGNEITGSLLEVLLQQETISMIFWIFTAAGLAIALLLTIYATAQSAFDLDFENKRPVSRVLTAMMKTFIQFFTVPFLVYFMIKLAAEIIKGIAYAMSGGNQTSLGRVVFTIASLDAAKDTAFNISTAAEGKVLGTDPSDTVRWPFYSLSGSKDYGKIEVVKEYFETIKFDYLIGFLAAVFLLFVMMICLITFVQRIFEVILLYLASPYFVAMMPLDDGEHFGRWRDMFIGKCFSGYGSVIAMRLYLLICPMMMGTEIQPSVEAIQNSPMLASPELTYLIKLFFLIGGAWAVFKSGPIITSLISSSSGQSEAMTQSAAGGFLYAHTAGKMMSKGKGMINSALHGGSKGRGGAGTGSQGGSLAGGKAQKFDGAKPAAGSKLGRMNKTDSSRAGVTTTAKPSVKSSMKSSEKPNAAATGFKRGVVPTTARTGKPLIGAHRAKAAQMNTAQSSSSSKSKDSFKTNGGFRIGKLVQSSYDDKGSHKIRVCGIGFDRNAEGKTTAVRLPGLKVQKKPDGSSFRVSKFHVPGVVNVKTNLESGSLKRRDISLLHGMGQFHQDESGFSVKATRFITASGGPDGSASDVRLGGLNIHNAADGKGFELGRMRYSSTSEGSQFNLGRVMSVQTDHKKGGLSGMSVLGIHYSASNHVSKREMTAPQQSTVTPRQSTETPRQSTVTPQQSTVTPRQTASAPQQKATPPRPTRPAPYPERKSRQGTSSNDNGTGGKKT